MKLSFYSALNVESPAFDNNGLIPLKYKDINPPLHIGKIPKRTKSLALIIENTNYSEGSFVNWVVWNIPTNGNIKENFIPGAQGLNREGKTGFCGFHHNPNHFFLFKVYALDTILDIPEDSTRDELIRAMDSSIIGSGILVGRFLEPEAEKINKTDSVRASAA